MSNYNNLTINYYINMRLITEKSETFFCIVIIIIIIYIYIYIYIYI